MARDWTKTLYPPSFRGIPFWIERDNIDTGRRLDVTEIPGSDIPFLEDLGAKARPIEISGYTIGDASDVQIAALEAAAAQPGAGILVLPRQGPVTARCHHIKCDRLRDKMGRFGFEAAFVLDPRSGPMATQPAYPAAYLAQLAFDAGDRMGAALAGMMTGFQV